MRSRNAFTLVELLIVITIIGILVAILIPSIAGTQLAARRLACAAQMKQMVMAIVNYAQDNRDALYNPGIGNAPGSAHGITNINGLISPIKYLTPDMNYDPALPRDYRYYTGSAGSPIAHYSIVLIIHATDATNASVSIRFKRFSDVPNDRALVLDTLRLVTNSNHPVRNGLPYWNMGFRDGSVLTVQLPRRAVEWWRGNAQANQWHVHNDMIRVMELVAAGKDPQYAGFGEVTPWPFATSPGTASHRYIPRRGGSTTAGKNHALSDE